ncbi:hypothetical protein BJ912DRAFT_1068028 [Pholiota molesta]|nr:hypothetical protein BJ912DRAFT_1068028 [Pholiota molesta]
MPSICVVELEEGAETCVIEPSISPVRAARTSLSHALPKFHLLPWRPMRPSPLKFAPLCISLPLSIPNGPPNFATVNQAEDDVDAYFVGAAPPV